MSLEKFIADQERQFQELQMRFLKLPPARNRSQQAERDAIVAEINAVNRTLQKARAALR